MKKILAMLLALVLCSLMLVSCGDEDTLGSYIENYPETPNTVEELTLSLYIITEADTAPFALNTVKRMITQHTELKYNTKLNINYVTAAEYDSVVKSAINGTDGAVANIVLINSPELIDTLVEGNKLADLSAYFEAKAYEDLNSQIPKALLEGSKIGGKIYSVPNNHLIGEYEYLVIDKAYCRDTLHYSDAKLKSYKSLEDASELCEEIGANFGEYVYVQKGNYELKAQIENSGKICNVIKYPTVDRAEAFSSAFAVVNAQQKYMDRSMQMIFALNNDSELKNLLQFGVEGTNYTMDGNNVVRVAEGDNYYNMNLLYTGNVFISKFCSELSWNEDVKYNASKQNNEAVMN